MSQDPPPTSSKRGWFLGAAALLLAGAVWLVLRSTSEQTPPVTAPTWTHEYPGKGRINSVTASKQRDGTEVVVAAGYAVTDDSGEDLRIVAYAADTGKILWEKRRTRPWADFQHSVSCAEDGNILLGSEIAEAVEGRHFLLRKLSIEDGAELWQWTIEAPKGRPPTSGSAHMARVAAVSSDRVWVSGMRLLADNLFERYLALLDGANGQQLWFSPLKTGGEPDDLHAEVHPLEVADAMVMSRVKSRDKPSSWVLQRLDQTTGKAKWQRELVQTLFHEPLHIVDEANGQVLVFGQQKPFQSTRQDEVISIDLETGIERWSNQLEYIDRFRGGPEGAGLDSNGNPVLFGVEKWTTEKIYWREWSMHPGLPFPLPETGTRDHYRPMSVAFSALDGSVVSQTRLSNRDEIPISWHYELGTRNVRAVLVRKWAEQELLKTFRVIRLDASGPLPPMTVGGYSISGYWPFFSTLTPSGQIVTTDDPAEQVAIWRIDVW